MARTPTDEPAPTTTSPAAAPRGRPHNRTREAVADAGRIDWRGSEDRRLLRAALRYVRDQLHQHVYACWVIPASESGLHVSAIGESTALLDLLLEIEALDLIGVACLLRGKDQRAQNRARAQRRRRTPTAPKPKPAPPAQK